MVFALRGKYAYWHFKFKNGDSGWLGGSIENLGSEIGQEFVLSKDHCIENTNGQWNEWVEYNGTQYNYDYEYSSGWIGHDNYLEMFCLGN